MPSVLVCCEESGIVRRAFRGRGWDAWSNDTEEAADLSPYHLKMDCFDAIKTRDYWDLIILHPPCDYLAVSGNRWYGAGCAHHEKRIESVEWTLNLWDVAVNHSSATALENPISVIFPLLNAPVQYVQPYHFGHPEMKNTGFALSRLPELRHVNPLDPPKPGTEEYIKWQKVWRMAPSPDRKKLRSRTYLMIADAMAHQWGEYVKASIAHG